MISSHLVLALFLLTQAFDGLFTYTKYLKTEMGVARLVGIP